MATDADLVTIDFPNHHQMLTERLWNLFSSKTRVDFNLSWGARSIGTHRFLLDLFLSSDKLQQAANTVQQSVELDDDCNVLESLLEFLYTGRLTVARGLLDTLLTLATDSDFYLLANVLQIDKRTNNWPRRSKRKIPPGTCTKTNKKSPTKKYPDIKPCYVALKRLSSLTVPSASSSGKITAEKLAKVGLESQIQNNLDGFFKPGLVEVNSGQQIESKSNGQVRRSPRVSSTNAGPIKISDVTDNDVSVDVEAVSAASDSDDVADNDASMDVNVELTASESGDAADNDFGDFGGTDSDSTDDDYVARRSTRAKNRSGKRKPKLHKCSECDETFTNPKVLRKHQQVVHSGEETFKCELCEDVFLAKRTVTRHMLRCHPGHLPLKTENISYKCSECDAVFTNRKVFRRHQLVHSSKETFKCEVCEKVFLTKRTAIKHTLIQHSDHLDIETDNSLHKCSVCDAAPFTNRKVLLEHQLIHFKEEISKCEVCERYFRTKQASIRHMLKEHPGYLTEESADRPHKCGECEAAFTNRKFLLQHQDTHTTARNFKCEFCEKSFRFKRALDRHTMEIHPEHSSRVCKLCGEKFERWKDVRLHLKSAHPDSTHDCVDCKKKFLSVQNLHRHRRQFHDGRPPLKCEICQKLFTDKKAFEHHALAHTTERPFKCDVCPKTYKDKIALRLHARTAHEPLEKKHKCDICPKAFHTKTYLTRHLLMHRGIRPHICEICGKGFGEVGALKNHQRVHSDVKMFKCTQCPRDFRHSHQLKIHVAAHHGEKTNQCNICGKFFSQYCSLVLHASVHSGEKPFGCDLCDKKFRIKNNLTLHRRSHTGEKPFPCQCGESFSRKSILEEHRQTHYGTNDIKFKATTKPGPASRVRSKTDKIPPLKLIKSGIKYVVSELVSDGAASTSVSSNAPVDLSAGLPTNGQLPSSFVPWSALTFSDLETQIIPVLSSKHLNNYSQNLHNL